MIENQNNVVQTAVTTIIRALSFMTYMPRNVSTHAAAG